MLRASDKARLRTIKDLDGAAIQLSQVCRLVLKPDLQDAELRSAIFKAIEREELEAAVSQVDSIVGNSQGACEGPSVFAAFAPYRSFRCNTHRAVRIGSTQLFGRKLNRAPRGNWRRVRSQGLRVLLSGSNPLSDVAIFS